MPSGCSPKSGPKVAVIQESTTRMRVFAGHSGWAPGQLSDEMETGSWLTLPAEADQVFGPDEHEQWSKLMARVTLGRWIDPSQIPDDPNVN